MCAGGGGGGPTQAGTLYTVPDQETYSDHWNSETSSWNYETKPGYTRDDSRSESGSKSGHFDRDTGYTYDKITGDFEEDKLTFYKENVWTDQSGDLNV